MSLIEKTSTIGLLRLYLNNHFTVRHNSWILPDIAFIVDTADDIAIVDDSDECDDIQIAVPIEDHRRSHYDDPLSCEPTCASPLISWLLSMVMGH